ncbi:hypothetical protein [Streptomyces sp. NPDC056169]|uniref:hypothetical protein n=1 Tax=Streptomyces sp. NPDC056169 TaxID=3345734 RepID=UPI0035DA0E66
MAAAPDRPRLTGPADAEADARLTPWPSTPSLAARSSPAKPACAASSPARTLLSPGRFLTWGYYPDRALCRTPANSADTPAMDDCHPLAASTPH